MTKPKEISVEAELVEYARKATFSDAWGTLTKKFDLGKDLNKCVPKGKVTDEDWVGILALGVGMMDLSQWVAGDAVCALENAGHSDVVTQLASDWKVSYSTLSGWARVCRYVKPEDRDARVKFTIYREVFNAKLAETPEDNLKEQQKLLKTAVKEQYTSTEVRNAIKQDKADSEPPKPQKRPYLVIPMNNVTAYTFHTEPQPYDEEGELQINIETGEFLGVQENKMTWLPSSYESKKDEQEEVPE